MTYFFVDDAFYDHPKVKALPRGTVRKGAVSLWTLAGAWSCRYLQDGLIPPHMIEELGGTNKDADALVATDLWHGPDHECDVCPYVPRGHYLFHDWPQWQKTKDQVERERKASRARMAKYRGKEGEQGT